MTQLSLFDSGDDRPAQAARLTPRLHALAEQGVYFGTSSWKYEGWLGNVYDAERYVTRGKFSQQKFEAECLAEYAATFPIVCGDFAFYQFPSPDYWKRLFGQTPASFLFGFKVPEEITVARWPRHARYGDTGWQANEAFLDADLFANLFTRRLAPYAGQVADADLRVRDVPASPPSRPWTTSSPGSTPSLRHSRAGSATASRSATPSIWGPAYFDLLARHGVAHVFNAWSRMPELEKQLEMPGAFTADFTVVRALLSKGRNYEQAVQQLHSLQARPGAGPCRQGRHAEDRRALAASAETGIPLCQ